ncbi:MAG: Fic family protein [Chloroflexia bacterium]|nr:Fic family protein [Chloroflexia bacterium]
MKLTDFRSPAAGEIVRSQAGIDAFVPAPLPPRITYADSDLVLVLSRADAALSELSGVGRQLPNPHLLISPYLRREAVLSSRIEGTRASLSDVYLGEIEAGEAGEAPEADRQEVANYVAALEHGLAWVREGRPLTLNLVTGLHARLMQNVRGEFSSPGRFRTVQNWIGPARSTAQNADFVPPPPELLMGCLTDWEQFLNARGDMPDLVQCAVLHGQFETIHPFIDGNGRIGRLLIPLFLVERQRLSQPLLYLSAYIEAHRPTYYDLLQRVRTDGDWIAWIRFFLEGVEVTAREALLQTTTLVDLRETFRAHLMGKAKAHALIDYLFSNPYLSVRHAAQILDVTTPTARAAIAVLEESGFVTEVTGRSWRRIYLCEPIMNAIMGNPKADTQQGDGSRQEVRTATG